MSEKDQIAFEMSDQIQALREAMIRSINDTVGSKKIGIAFSGGVDSTLLAKLCCDAGFDVTLLTVGFEISHDMDFSKKIASMLGLKHITHVISQESFQVIAKQIWLEIKNGSLSWIENGIAFYYISHLAAENKIMTVLTSNGIDELFCGYNAYREVFEQGDEAVMSLMAVKLENELKMMKCINTILFNVGVRILQPFLSDFFIQFAKTIPVSEKILGKDDLARKHIIRKLAVSTGVPTESALKRKKALQYGSLIHKNLMKIRKTWNMIY